MADKKHLEILRKGVEVWNQWRKDNPDLRPNLSFADLNNADLNSANFNNANLYSAYLESANLNNANLYSAYLESAIFVSANLVSANLYRAYLQSADLESAYLQSADLESAYLQSANLVSANLGSAILVSANLKGVQALATNFQGTTLTGACIEDWNINSETNLQNVKCDYIYLRENKQDRRPHDPNKIFAPGEFTQLFQKALETVDLIFSEGIEWAAFLESFQQLQAEVNSEELAIQAIEKKSGGAFVVRLEVPQEANKAEIEEYIRQEYDAKVKVIEANYQKQLQGKDEIIDAKEELIKAHKEQSTDILEMAKIYAQNQPDIVNKISVVSGDSYNAETAGIVHSEGDISGDAEIAGEIDEIDAYQKSANQLTNLAFGLIVTATLSITTAALTIIVPMVINLLSNQ